MSEEQDFEQLNLALGRLQFAESEVARLHGNCHNREVYILEQRRNIARLCKIIRHRGKRIKRLEKRLADLLAQGGSGAHGHKAE